MKKGRFFASVLSVLLSAMLPLSSVLAASADSAVTAADNTASTTAAVDDTHPGFRVQGRFLYDSTGEKVILYGINKMCIWTDIDGEPSFSEIAKTGANCVRIVWNTTGTAEQLDTVITNCRKEHMIPIIELHDATGDFTKLQSLVDYWVEPEIVNVIKKHQQYLLVNIGNEVGNQVSESDYLEGYKKAVSRMREAEIHVPLIIDASSYGQDINMLQSCGPDLIAADPDANLMFSVHMYWPPEYGYSAQMVIDELQESKDMNLPLLVGEFGNAVDTTENGVIPYQTIIEYCYKDEIGYLPWSWGPGNNPQTFLDMTSDSTYDTLSGWGLDVAVTNTYSIKNIAQRPASMLSSPAPTAPEEPMPAGNLALNKAAFSNTCESDSYAASNVTDGDFETRWASESGSDPGWVYVDLGSSKEINRVIIRWEAAYATQYKVQVSDDAQTWSDIYTTYNGTGGTADLSVSGTGRYVRIYGSQRYNYSWGYSIYDIGVYGPDSEMSASVTPATAVFDKCIANQEDIAVTMTANGNALTAVKNGDTVLTKDTDYTIDGDVCTIKKEYLATLENGKARLTFDFDGGIDPFIFVAIGDTSPSAYIRPSRQDFNLSPAAQSDITVTKYDNGKTFEGIYNGTKALVEGTDYILDGDSVTVKKEYLANLTTGVTRLTFDYDSGDDPVLRVNITDTTPSSTISPETASFDLKPSKQADITVTPDYNGNTLKGIYNGTDALEKDTDYTVSDDGTVTILSTYLAKQSLGTLKLTLDFSGGMDSVLTVTIIDTSSSSITPTNAAFDLNEAKQADISVTADYNGNTLDGIYNGTTALVKGTDYTVSGNTITIKKSYLATLSEGTTILTFDFSCGTDPNLKITVKNTSGMDTENIEVQMFNANTQNSTNGITPRFKLINTGSEPIDLSTVTLRYYFTEDGTQDESFWCDWSSAGSSNVTGTFKKLATATDTADTYLEIGFTSGAGTLAAGSNVEIQVRFAKNDWSNYDQTNDYSFNSSGSSYTDWNKITAYEDGIIYWGVEPTGSAVTTKTISSLEKVTATTTAGTAPTLPATIKATYSDGTTTDVSVTWDTIDASDYAQAGIFVVTGTVAGTDLKAACAVTVKALPEEVTISLLEKVKATTTVGTAPILPDTVKATYSDGTTADVSVTWDTFDASDYAQAGIFVVTGTVAGTDLKAVCAVTVKAAPEEATISSLEKVTATTTVGTAPTLPATVEATYSDGTTADVSVTWDTVDASDYAQAGTVIVTGTVAGTDKKAACAVTVKEAAVVVSSDLEVQTYNGNTQAITNGLSVRFKLTNKGTSAIDLSTITLRYYYTKDGTQAQCFWCDWSPVGSQNVIGTFNDLADSVTGADNYLEISFASAAGSLAPGASIEVQTRIAKADWTNYNQADDYSFNSTSTIYTDWAKVTAYQSGDLILGSEPV